MIIQKYLAIYGKFFNFTGWLLTGIVIVFLIASGFLMWPGLHHDSALFVPVVINNALGNNWRIESYTPLLVEMGSDQYTSHGVLYPIFFGSLLKANTYNLLLIYSGLVNAITCGIYIFLFHRALEEEMPIFGFLASSVLGAVASVICIELQGRPEHLVPFLAALPFLLREFPASKRYARYVAYGMPGLIFTLSPLPGVIYGMGVLVWITLHYHLKNLWQELIKSGILSIGSIILIIWIFCPFSLWEWITNTLFSGIKIAPIINGWSLLINTRFSLTLPGWNWIIVLVVTIGFLTFLRRGLIWLLVICLVIGAGMATRLQSYGYVGFLPLLLLLLIGKYRNWMSINYSKKEWISYFSIAFSGLYFMALMRLLFLSFIYIEAGVSFSETKATLEKLRVNLDINKERIGFIWITRPSFIVLKTVENSIITINNSACDSLDDVAGKYEKKFGKKISYILLPQLVPSDPPSTLNKGEFILIHDGWIKDRPKFMGIRLGGPMPGYQFALYKRGHISDLSPKDDFDNPDKLNTRK